MIKQYTKDFRYMQPEAIVVEICRHLKEQGGPATTTTGCRYRTTDGRACAVGCLIPDDVYAATWRKLEGNGAGHVASVLRLATPMAADYQLKLAVLYAAQSAHDAAASAGKSSSFYPAFLRLFQERLYVGPGYENKESIDRLIMLVTEQA